MLALGESSDWILWLVIIGIVVTLLVLLVNTFLSESIGGLFKMSF